MYLRSRNILPTATCCIRQLRTLRKVSPPPVIDIESQLSKYPPAIRKHVMEEAQHSQTSGKLDEIPAEEFEIGLISEFLNNATSQKDLDSEFWRSVRVMTKSFIKARLNGHIDLFVRLFEAAKDINDSTLRQTMIFWVGRYIYQQKKVRFDPINEIEFLDSLVANSRAFSAIKLWSSRKFQKEDVTDKSLWDEVGILYYLDAGLIHRANSLAVKLLNENTALLSTRIVTSLINAWSYQIQRRRTVKDAELYAELWVKTFLKICSEQSQLESVLHSLILCRQWKLSAQVVEHLPNIEADASEALNLPTLSNAFINSSKTKSYHEEDFLMLFQTLLNKIPSLATNHSVSSTLVLSFARQGDHASTLQILEDLVDRGVKVPTLIFGEIIKSLLKSSPEHRTSMAHKIQSLSTSPETVLEIIKCIKEGQELNVFVKEYMHDQHGKVTPELSLEILRKRAFSLLDESRLIGLGLDDNTWMYLWHYSSKGIIATPPEKLAGAIAGHSVSTNQLLFMCMSFIKHSSSFEEGVSRLFASLEKLPPATPTQAVLVLGTLKKLQCNQRTPLRPSKKLKSLNAEKVSNENLVPWVNVAERAETFLNIPNLSKPSRS